MSRSLLPFFFYFFLCCQLPALAYSDTSSPRIRINRTTRTMAVYDSSGAVVLSSPIGIGRGGLREKSSMSDFVTPTGSFEVDLILAPGHQFSVAPRMTNRYRNSQEFFPLLSTPQGLQTLFQNMNALDFDRDGTADGAYGSAYIGLHSESVVTGPKMRFYKGTPYWYSIALHGSSDEIASIGAATSGGCVHVRKADFETILSGGLVSIGSKVQIIDE